MKDFTEVRSLLNYFEEIEIMYSVAKEVDVVYQHPIDEDCVIFRTELGVSKIPKSILNHPNLLEYMEKYK